MPKEKSQFLTIYIRGLPRALREQFHGHCAARGMTMKDKIIQLMEDTVKGKHDRLTQRLRKVRA